jgi:hypothetical protein
VAAFLVKQAVRLLLVNLRGMDSFAIETDRLALLS